MKNSRLLFLINIWSDYFDDVDDDYLQGLKLLLED